MNHRRQLSRVGAVLAALAVAITGCSVATEPVSEPSALPEPPVYVSTWEEPAPTQLAPLRGTTVEAGSVSNPALSAKVDNHPYARPQLGLELADIVYEELVEGGITRYVPVWQSHIPELIGPVRSIRPMDPDIISPYRGIVAYSGGQWRFLTQMWDAPVYNAVHGQSDTKDTFFRMKGRRAPHDVIVRAQEVVEQHADLGPPEQQWAFAHDAASTNVVKEGAAVATIEYRFSSWGRGTWDWDAASGSYLRAQQGDPDLDANGDQLSATNVVILRVGVVDDGGVPKTMLVGSGEAWVSTGGSYIAATWHKASRDEPVRLIDAHGFTVQFAPGNTWVQLVPHSGSVGFVAP